MVGLRHSVPIGELCGQGSSILVLLLLLLVPVAFLTHTLVGSVVHGEDLFVFARVGRRLGYLLILLMLWIISELGGVRCGTCLHKSVDLRVDDHLGGVILL